MRSRTVCSMSQHNYTHNNHTVFPVCWQTYPNKLVIDDGQGTRLEKDPTIILCGDGVGVVFYDLDVLDLMDLDELEKDTIFEFDCVEELEDFIKPKE